MSNKLIDNILEIKRQKDEYIVPENIKSGVSIFGINGTLEEGIDTSDANAVAGDIISGKTAYVDGEKITGTIVNNGAINMTPTTSQQTIPEGYTSGGMVGAVTSSIDANIIPTNIRAGVSVLGIQGNLEPDKPDQSKTVTPTTSEQVVQADTGYELAQVTVEAVDNTIDENIVAENIKEGVSILGVEGTLQEGIEPVIKQGTLCKSISFDEQKLDEFALNMAQVISNQDLEHLYGHYFAYTITDFNTEEPGDWNYPGYPRESRVDLISFAPYVLRINKFDEKINTPTKEYFYFNTYYTQAFAGLDSAIGGGFVQNFLNGFDDLTQEQLFSLSGWYEAFNDLENDKVVLRQVTIQEVGTIDDCIISSIQRESALSIYQSLNQVHYDILLNEIDNCIVFTEYDDTNSSSDGLSKLKKILFGTYTQDFLGNASVNTTSTDDVRRGKRFYNNRGLWDGTNPLRLFSTTDAMNQSMYGYNGDVNVVYDTTNDEFSGVYKSVPVINNASLRALPISDMDGIFDGKHTYTYRTYYDEFDRFPITITLDRLNSLVNGKQICAVGYGIVNASMMWYVIEAKDSNGNSLTDVTPIIIRSANYGNGIGFFEDSNVESFTIYPSSGNSVTKNMSELSTAYIYDKENGYKTIRQWSKTSIANYFLFNSQYTDFNCSIGQITNDRSIAEAGYGVVYPSITAQDVVSIHGTKMSYESMLPIDIADYEYALELTEQLLGGVEE